MGLSSKLVLATKKAGMLINWQGNVSLALTYAGLDAYVYRAIPVFIKMKERGVCLPYCKQLKAIPKFIM